MPNFPRRPGDPALKNPLTSSHVLVRLKPDTTDSVNESGQSVSFACINAEPPSRRESRKMPNFPRRPGDPALKNPLTSSRELVRLKPDTTDSVNESGQSVSFACINAEPLSRRESRKMPNFPRRPGDPALKNPLTSSRVLVRLKPDTTDSVNETGQSVSFACINAGPPSRRESRKMPNFVGVPATQR